MKYIAIIPARGLSKGVPRKNIKILAGKPLIAWTIEAALSSKLINRVIVSTEDQEIAEISKFYGAEVPFMRPIELSQDDTPTLLVLQNMIKRLDIKDIDNIITLQPTSPLRTTNHLNEAIYKFERCPDSNCLVSCIEVPHNFTPDSIMKISNEGFLQNFNEDNIQPKYLRRQDKPKYYARNGAAIYITKKDIINNGILSGNIMPYYMDKFSSLDIDTEDDFILAEILFKLKNDL